MLWLPGLDVDAEVTFLVDTGADTTVLHPEDTSRLFTDAQWSKVRASEPMRIGGAGRSLPYYPHDAVIYFVSDGQFVEPVEFTIWVGEEDASISSIESLLGRDVLRHFTTTFAGLERLTMTRR